MAAYIPVPPGLNEGQIQNSFQPDKTSAYLLWGGSTDRCPVFLFAQNARHDQHGGHLHDGHYAAVLLPRNV